MAAAELPLPPALRSIVDQFAAHVDAPVLCIPRSESAPKALLSIDGGGLRGIIPAVVLCYIEQAIKHVVLEQRARWPGLVPESVKNAKDFHIELADYFDLFAGNSAGSFLSTFLATRGAETSSGLPLLKALGVRPGSAASLAVFWIHAAMVFSKIGPIDWTNNEAYKESRKMSSDVFDKFVVDVLGERPLSSVEKSLYIVTADLAGANAVGFWKDSKSQTTGTDAAPISSHSTDTVPGRDFTLWHIVRTSSSLPSAYYPFHVRSIPPTPQELEFESIMADGVLTANNPTSMALSWFLSSQSVEPEQVAVLSLGTSRAGPKFKTIEDVIKEYTNPAFIWTQFALNSNPAAALPKAMFKGSDRYLRISSVYPGLAGEKFEGKEKEEYEKKWNAVWTTADLNTIYEVGMELGREFEEEVKVWARKYLFGTN